MAKETTKYYENIINELQKNHNQLKNEYKNIQSGITAQVNESTSTGAGTAPVRSLHYGKLATTGSQITSIHAINDTTGSFDADSYMLVFGSD